MLNEYYYLIFLATMNDFILIDPLFENLRDDTEFLEIVKRAQDEKATMRTHLNTMIEREEIDM